MSTARLFSSRNVACLAPAAALTIPLSTVSLALALRYIPVRYDRTLGETGVLLAARTALSIAVLLGALPLVARFVLRRSPRLRDLRAAQASAALVAAGLAVLGAAPNLAAAVVALAVFTLGSGLPSLSRAILADVWPKSGGGRLFGALATLEIYGFLASALGLGAVFQAGLEAALGGGPRALLGLPFFCAAAVALLCSGALWAVRLPPSHPPWDADGLEEQLVNPIEAAVYPVVV